MKFKRYKRTQNKKQVLLPPLSPGTPGQSFFSGPRDALCIYNYMPTSIFYTSHCIFYILFCLLHFPLNLEIIPCLCT